MKAMEQYFHVVLFVFDKVCKMKFKIFSSILNLALLGVKGLTYTNMHFNFQRPWRASFLACLKDVSKLESDSPRIAKFAWRRGDPPEGLPVFLFSFTVCFTCNVGYNRHYHLTPPKNNWLEWPLNHGNGFSKISWPTVKPESNCLIGWVMLRDVDTMPYQTASTTSQQMRCVGAGTENKERVKRLQYFEIKRNVEKMLRQTVLKIVERGCQTASTSALKKCWDRLLGL